MKGVRGFVNMVAARSSERSQCVTRRREWGYGKGREAVGICFVTQISPLAFEKNSSMPDTYPHSFTDRNSTNSQPLY